MKSKCDIVNISNNNILLKITDCIGLHNKIVNEKDELIGKIIKILGPVSAPYALAYIVKKPENMDNIYVEC
ncbi:MAG: hypothetical protein QXZ44_05370 [Ferroplasma sp.]